MCSCWRRAESIRPDRRGYIRSSTVPSDAGIRAVSGARRVPPGHEPDAEHRGAAHGDARFPTGACSDGGGGNPFRKSGFKPLGDQTWTTVAGFRADGLRSDHTADVAAQWQGTCSGRKGWRRTTLGHQCCSTRVTTTFAAGGGMGTARERHGDAAFVGQGAGRGRAHVLGPQLPARPSAEIYDPVTDTFARRRR